VDYHATYRQKFIPHAADYVRAACSNHHCAQPNEEKKENCISKNPLFIATPAGVAAAFSYSKIVCRIAFKVAEMLGFLLMRKKYFLYFCGFAGV
jgi:hypothetical protein